MAWNVYTVTVQHDKGKQRLRLLAQTREAAIRSVMAAEGCPRCAVLGVERQIKTSARRTPR